MWQTPIHIRQIEPFEPESVMCDIKVRLQENADNKYICKSNEGEKSDTLKTNIIEFDGAENIKHRGLSRQTLRIKRI